MSVSDKLLIFVIAVIIGAAGLYLALSVECGYQFSPDKFSPTGISGTYECDRPRELRALVLLVLSAVLVMVISYHPLLRFFRWIARALFRSFYALTNRDLRKIFQGIADRWRQESK